jgi:hypothetical protein
VRADEKRDRHQRGSGNPLADGCLSTVDSSRPCVVRHPADRGVRRHVDDVRSPVPAVAPSMPQPEEPERHEQQRQEDHVAGRDQEDEACDRYSDCQCPDHRVVGDGCSSPTVVFDMGSSTGKWLVKACLG